MYINVNYAAGFYTSHALTHSHTLSGRQKDKGKKKGDDLLSHR